MKKAKKGEMDGRERQRAVCYQLLERWVPAAASEPVEEGLKAATLVLKILERLARLDGLDAAEKRELTVTELADPVELARRVRVVSPLLMARIQALEASSGKPPQTPPNHPAQT